MNNQPIAIKYETLIHIEDVYDQECTLVIFKYEDKFYWGMNDGFPYLSDFSEIPESLYNEIAELQKTRPAKLESQSDYFKIELRIPEKDIIDKLKSIAS